MLTREPDADMLLAALAVGGSAETTPIAIYEAVLGVSRKRQWSVAEAETHVGDFLRAASITVQPIEPETAHIALEAFARYGRGRGHRRGSTLATVSFTLKPRSVAPRFFTRATISRRRTSRARPERRLLSVRPHLTAGLGVSICRGRTAEGNRDRVVGR
jgi:uncharacterized protein with PIN domain